MRTFNIQMFAPISNATVKNGYLEIEGVLTVEVADKNNGWVMDYEESKKYFLDWFNEIYNATMKSTHGQAPSWGNVRSEHTKLNVGKILAKPVFDDVNKRIIARVQVTDKETIRKISNGELCAFSWSGVKMPVTTKVLQKWMQLPDGGNRYIGRPFELTITDNPNQEGTYFAICNSVGEPGFNLTDDKGVTKFIKIKGDNKMELTVEQLEQIKNTANEAAKKAVEDAGKELLEQVKTTMGTLLTEVKNSVTEVKNSVDAHKVEVKTLLEKIPEPSSIVTKEKSADEAPKMNFEQIENQAGIKLSDSDKKALEAINTLTFGKKTKVA